MRLASLGVVQSENPLGRGHLYGPDPRASPSKSSSIRPLSWAYRLSILSCTARGITRLVHGRSPIRCLSSRQSSDDGTATLPSGRGAQQARRAPPRSDPKPDAFGEEADPSVPHDSATRSVAGALQSLRRRRLSTTVEYCAPGAGRNLRAQQALGGPVTPLPCPLAGSCRLAAR